MKQNWEKLYADMLSDLNRCQALQLPEAEIAECCCRIAMNYWLKVKEMFKDSVNYDEEEEINFFKYVKPRFTSHIEYNLVISQAILFLPTETEALVTYWEEETKKYQRFFDKHQEFINYYDSNNTENDSRYFLPRNNRQETPVQERIYQDEECRSSHDCIVRGLLANSMYYEFASSKLAAFGSKPVAVAEKLPVYHGKKQLFV